MRYNDLQSCPPGEFKRLTGVTKETFETMLAVLKQKRPRGRRCKLALADQLLMTLMYWREYRSQLHIAHAYGVSEATVCRTIVKIENALKTSEQFHLPGRKTLSASQTLYSVVLLDATECAIERPKKSNDSATAARKSAIPSKHS